MPKILIDLDIDDDLKNNIEEKFIRNKYPVYLVEVG
jgi:hypothetical protein